MATVTQQIDTRLLPSWMEQTDNSRRIKHCKIALAKAIDLVLTPVQKRQIQMYYWQNLSKKQIASELGTSYPAVTKSVQNAENAIKSYIELYMQIYDALESDWIKEMQI